MAILGIIYILLGYWAVGKTIWANKILIGTSNALTFNRVFYALILGWLLIPWALIKVFVFHR